MSETIYYFPYTHINHYVDLSKQTLTELNYQVKSYRRLYRWTNLFRYKRNTVVLNWYEDRPYRKSFTRFKQHIELLRTLFGIVLMPLFCRRIIWVRHNYFPHNLGQHQPSSPSPPRPLSHRISCFLLDRMASEIVSLEKTDFCTDVVCHPLYRSDMQISKDIQSVKMANNTQIDYLFFGTIKPYKRLHELLEIWPAELPLHIVGNCSDQAYAQYLNDIIKQRELNRILWQNAYVDDDVLDNLLARVRYVIMPHEDNSMICSGTFYHAASFGANFICFASKFAQSKAQTHSFVHQIDKDQLTAKNLAELEYIPRQRVMQQCIQEYGQEAQRLAWKNLLKGSRNF